jgi:N6-adenosine-specific RNA methylase IME4
MNFPTGKYNLIYADPPWSYRDKAAAGKRGASFKYPTLGIDDLAELPVASIAAPDCLLAMWWVGPQPQEALDLVRAWGFELKNMTGFTWHKLTVKGKSHFGMGHLSRGNCENCLFAVRGKPKRVSASVRQFVEAPIREHSQKPDQVRDRLVQLMGDVPRIELFSRVHTKNWDFWGNEVGKLDLPSPSA